MTKKFGVLLAVALFFSACAHQYRPIVDFQGKSRQQYEFDLQE